MSDDATDGEGWVDPQPLHTAAMLGDLAALVARVEAGDDINAFDADLRLTPLHYAVRNGNVPIARYLLERGADVDARDEARINNTPLADATQEISLEMAQLLIDFGADPTIRVGMQLNALERVANRKRGDGPSVRALLESAAGRRRRGMPHRKIDS